MIKVGILFGGVSREREISFAGGRTVFDNLNKSIFEAVPLFLDSLGNLIELDWQYIYKGTIRDFYPPVEVQPEISQFQLYAEHLQNESIDWDAAIAAVGTKTEWTQLPNKIDLMFLALHGEQGEDGSVQGLLDFYKIPYTGSGILASGIGMNKAFQKEILQPTPFNKTQFFSIERNKWQANSSQHFLDKVKSEIGFPYVVRPANQGSSIGVGIINHDELSVFEEAINAAFFIKKVATNEWTTLDVEGKEQWLKNLMDIKGDIGLPVKLGEEIIYHPKDLWTKLDAAFEQGANEVVLESIYEENEVVVESFIDGREFSCVVIEDENGQPIALPPTEIVKTKEVYDYRSKYLPGLSRKVTPIDLPNEGIEAIRKACSELYELLRFNVYARIDGFYKADGTIVLNDPNTTSGMLPSSFFFHQAAEIGLNPSQFITYIISTSIKARIKEGGDVGNIRALNQRLESALKAQAQQGADKLQVAVILGGYSSERHISVESGRNIFEKLASSDKYAPTPVFLSQQAGKITLHKIPIHLLLKDNADDITEKLSVKTSHAIIDSIRQETAAIIQQFGKASYNFFPEQIEIADLQNFNAVFIAIHGRPGEDGNLQAHLEQMNIPYNGSPSHSAAITIDKHRTKALLRAEGFVVADDMLIQKSDYLSNPEQVLAELQTKFKFPIIAKPVDDGCSSAVKKVDDVESLQHFAAAIFRDTEEVSEDLRTALGLKHKEEFPQKDVILIESLIDDNGANHFLEITGGMLTHNGESAIEFESFEPSEALAGDAILSLEEKFLAGQGQNITPARYDKDANKRLKISKQVQADLVRAAKILGVEGYCRIDAFVRVFNEDEVETIIIEVNSLPGMTPATCIFHQAAINNYQPIDFIDKILTYAINKQNIEAA